MWQTVMLLQPEPLVAHLPTRELEVLPELQLQEQLLSEDLARCLNTNMKHINLGLTNTNQTNRIIIYLATGSD